MLSDTDLIKVQKVAEKLSDRVTLLACGTGSRDIFEQNLMNTARQIAGVSMEVIGLQEGDVPAMPGKPSISIASEGNGPVHYLAVPEGPELDPFLDAVAWFGGTLLPPVSPALERLAESRPSGHVLVLMAAACPHCPVVVRRALSLAVGRPSITVTIADAVQFPDLADAYKVKSTPTVVINEGATFIGNVTEEQMVTHVVPSQGIESLTEILSSMIESGRAEDAAALAVKENAPEALIPIFRSVEFSRRMGAMVTMEEALELAPRSLDPIVEDLCKLLFHEEPGIRGDAAEILSRIGSPAAIPALREAEKDENPDVREAVQEALEAIEN